MRGAGAVEFVGKHELGVQWTAAEHERLRVAVPNASSENLGRQQVTGELDTAERKPRRTGQRLRERRLAHTRDVLDEEMPLLQATRTNTTQWRPRLPSRMEAMASRKAAIRSGARRRRTGRFKFHGCLAREVASTDARRSPIGHITRHAPPRVTERHPLFRTRTGEADSACTAGGRPCEPSIECVIIREMPDAGEAMRCREGAS